MVAGATQAAAWPHDGIAPLEMWDVVVDGRTLFARRDELTFFASLADAASALRRGDATREAGERLAARSWDSVAIAGGALDAARARAAFVAAGLDVEVVSTDPFFTATAAKAVLGARDAVGNAGHAAVVVDVGQTAIKAVGPGGRVHCPRRAPHDDRALFAGDIAAALSEASGDRAPTFVLLALPCEVQVQIESGALVLGASTYPTEGDGTALAVDVLARADLAETRIALVNDAVLAAWALARVSPRPSRSRLVLTVGYGVGAAFVAAASPPRPAR